MLFEEVCNHKGNPMVQRTAHQSFMAAIKQEPVRVPRLQSLKGYGLLGMELIYDHIKHWLSKTPITEPGFNVPQEHKSKARISPYVCRTQRLQENPSSPGVVMYVAFALCLIAIVVAIVGSVGFVVNLIYIEPNGSGTLAATLVAVYCLYKKQS